MSAGLKVELLPVLSLWMFYTSCSVCNGHVMAPGFGTLTVYMSALQATFTTAYLHTVSAYHRV